MQKTHATNHKTIQDAVKVGCKNILADQETLINELKGFLDHQLSMLEAVCDEECRTPTAREYFNFLFKSN